MKQDLEMITEEGMSEVTGKNTLTLYEKAREKASSYLVDFAAGTTFFTPIMALNEHYLSGMDWNKVGNSRLGAIGIHAFTMRPIGLIRNYLAKKWEVTKKSPWYQQLAVNVAAATPIQTIVYSGVLLNAGVSKEEFATALPTGLLLTAALMGPIGSVKLFGSYMDRFRKAFGKEPAIR